MSIYTDCKDAVRSLLKESTITTQGVQGVFTELDVIFLAARQASVHEREPDARVAWMKLARREASQVMGELFGKHQVVRYGPVSLKSLGFEHQDYARIATKIIYAHPELGPREIKSPNGTFPRIFFWEDTLTKQGRRGGANRNDLKPWSEQDINRTLPEKKIKPTTPEQREIIRLKAENAALYTKLEESETELHRLREHYAQVIPRSEVEGLLGSLNDRLSSLEGR